MKRSSIVFLSLLGLAALGVSTGASAAGRGGCWGGSCRVSVDTKAVNTCPDRYWQSSTDNPDFQVLYVKGRILGGRWTSTGQWVCYHAGTWGCCCGKSCKCGEDCDCEPMCVQQLPDWQTHGVKRDTQPANDRYEFRGKETTREKVKKIIEGKDDGKLIDDSGKKFLTVIAKDPATRKRIAEDLKTSPHLAPLVPSYRLQVYDPAAKVDATLIAPFRVEADERYAKSGTMVCVQWPEGPDGRSRPVCVYDYEGPEVLAGQLRTIDATYDPNKVPVVPDPKKKPKKTPGGDDDASPFANALWPLMFPVAALGGAYLYRRRYP